MFKIDQRHDRLVDGSGCCLTVHVDDERDTTGVVFVGKGSYRPRGPGVLIGLTSYAASPAHPSSRFRLRSQITWITVRLGTSGSHSVQWRPDQGAVYCRDAGTDLADCCVTQGCQGWSDARLEQIVRFVSAVADPASAVAGLPILPADNQRGQ